MTKNSVLKSSNNYYFYNQSAKNPIISSIVDKSVIKLLYDQQN